MKRQLTARVEFPLVAPCGRVERVEKAQSSSNCQAGGREVWATGRVVDAEDGVAAHSSQLLFWWWWLSIWRTLPSTVLFLLRTHRACFATRTTRVQGTR